MFVEVLIVSPFYTSRAFAILSPLWAEWFLKSKTVLYRVIVEQLEV
jgi:hypothetical protein